MSCTTSGGPEQKDLQLACRVFVPVAKSKLLQRHKQLLSSSPLAPCAEGGFMTRWDTTCSNAVWFKKRCQSGGTLMDPESTTFTVSHCLSSCQLHKWKQLISWNRWRSRIRVVVSEWSWFQGVTETCCRGKHADLRQIRREQENRRELLNGRVNQSLH